MKTKKVTLRTAIVRAANQLGLNMRIVETQYTNPKHALIVECEAQTQIKFLNIFNQTVEKAGKQKFDRKQDGIYFYF